MKPIEILKPIGYNNIYETNRILYNSRLVRLSLGHFGDCKPIKSSLLKEIRFHTGKGYRIYFAEIDNTIVLLLHAGDKDSQVKDIQKANEYFTKYKLEKDL